jgi:hypothetical protein
LHDAGVPVRHPRCTSPTSSSACTAGHGLASSTRSRHPVRGLVIQSFLGEVPASSVTRPASTGHPAPDAHPRLPAAGRPGPGGDHDGRHQHVERGDDRTVATFDDARPYRSPGRLPRLCGDPVAGDDRGRGDRRGPDLSSSPASPSGTSSRG